MLGPKNPAIPPFINIGQRLEGVGESEELKAFTTAGFFGSEYGPFNIPFPQEAARAVRPPASMTPLQSANTAFMTEHASELTAMENRLSRNRAWQFVRPPTTRVPY